MVEVLDRVPTYPGRVTLSPVPGKANTYDMVRADEPVEPGTPINRALFQALISDMDAIRQRVDDKLFEMSQRARVADLAAGAVFGLYENGVLVPFIKVSNDYSATGRTLAVRKNCITSDVLASDSETRYENCRTDLWLNNEYLSVLDSATQGVLSAVPVQVFAQSGATMISRMVFLMSKAEYSITDGGAGLGDFGAYFTTAERRIATLDGTPTIYWVRELGGNAGYITVNGGIGFSSPSAIVAGIRPALTLPADFEVTTSVPSTANVMATAEVL